jgi:hypothetical protein
MDTQHSQPPNLATRLRLAGVDERVAALLAAATEEAFGVEQLRHDDLAAAERLIAIVETAARRAGPCAVNKFALELMELLAGAPDLRDRLSRPQPELAPA